jgi:hypothetical protein
MGLSHVRKSDLQKCLSELFPHGRIPEDKPALVRQVFAHLRRQDSGDMQGLSREGGLELERWLKGE